MSDLSDQDFVMDVQGEDGVAEVAVLKLREGDHFIVETVDGQDPPKSKDEKWIINVSTQFGCPVGCPFCDAGGSFAGNLTVDELLAQVRWALDRNPGQAPRCQKLKVHFARMGEPALNDAVIGALERLPDMVKSPGLWGCLATVAPRGREAWFDRLLDVKSASYHGHFQLQFSVQSTDPSARARLIPIPTWDMEDIAVFGERFFRPGDRRVILNFALAQGFEFDPDRISAVFSPEKFAVKLTPVNPTARGEENGFVTRLRGKDDEKLNHAMSVLEERGWDVIVSIGDVREDRIGSNCGQAVRVFRNKVALDGIR